MTAEIDLLEFPRGRVYVTAADDAVPIFSGAHRVTGFVLHNNDAANAAELEFLSSDGAHTYFTYAVPKGASVHLALKFYADLGLSIVNGGASSCDITPLWVPSQR